MDWVIRGVLTPEEQLQLLQWRPSNGGGGLRCHNGG